MRGWRRLLRWRWRPISASIRPLRLLPRRWPLPLVWRLSFFPTLLMGIFSTRVNRAGGAGTADAFTSGYIVYFQFLGVLTILLLGSAGGDWLRRHVNQFCDQCHHYQDTRIGAGDGGFDPCADRCGQAMQYD